LYTKFSTFEAFSFDEKIYNFYQKPKEIMIKMVQEPLRESKRAQEERDRVRETKRQRICLW
jgi:hypothetical protein